MGRNLQTSCNPRFSFQPGDTQPRPHKRRGAAPTKSLCIHAKSRLQRARQASRKHWLQMDSTIWKGDAVHWAKKERNPLSQCALSTKTGCGEKEGVRECGAGCLGCGLSDEHMDSLAAQTQNILGRIRKKYMVLVSPERGSWWLGDGVGGRLYHIPCCTLLIFRP